MKERKETIERGKRRQRVQRDSEYLLELWDHLEFTERVWCYLRVEDIFMNPQFLFSLQLSSHNIRTTPLVHIHMSLPTSSIPGVKNKVSFHWNLVDLSFDDNSDSLLCWFCLLLFKAFRNRVAKVLVIKKSYFFEIKTFLIQYCLIYF